ncbi:MAG: hypothetical protein HOM11_03920 [Methylococcales bacterium]|jgi:hypothetical protein|nr:hypothetical protein [Methylococcales bacterium]MBT7444263.1 hypothetical protein [Methylococcales bacterium]
MSTIALSPQLIEAVGKVIEEHDSSATDAGIKMQYTAAVLGIMMAESDVEGSKQELFQEVAAFVEHVMTQQMAQSAPATPPPPPPQDAFGIWKPKK